MTRNHPIRVENLLRGKVIRLKAKFAKVSAHLEAARRENEDLKQRIAKCEEELAMSRKLHKGLMVEIEKDAATVFSGDNNED